MFSYPAGILVPSLLCSLTPSFPVPWLHLLSWSSMQVSKPILLLPSGLVGFPHFVGCDLASEAGERRLWRSSGLALWCILWFCLKQMKWGHGAHRLGKSYPLYFSKKEEKGLKVTVRGCGRTYWEDFCQQGEETWGSRDIRYFGNWGCFWKSEHKRDWARAPLNKRWKKDGRTWSGHNSAYLGEEATESK